MTLVEQVAVLYSDKLLFIYLTYVGKRDAVIIQIRARTWHVFFEFRMPASGGWEGCGPCREGWADQEPRQVRD